MKDLTAAADAATLHVGRYFDRDALADALMGGRSGPRSR